MNSDDAQSENRSETPAIRTELPDWQDDERSDRPDGSVETQLHGNTEYDNPYSGPVFKQTKLWTGTTVEKLWMDNLPNAGLPASRAQELRFNQYVRAEIVTLPDAAGNPHLSAIREFSFDKNGKLDAPPNTLLFAFIDPARRRAA
ncbi:MAG: hypothetical protein IPK58_07480 [Acidobacteria bacterium]|nr:hypothetical protein [Acidobacteriota bacterium]